MQRFSHSKSYITKLGIYLDIIGTLTMPLYIVIFNKIPSLYLIISYLGISTLIFIHLLTIYAKNLVRLKNADLNRDYNLNRKEFNNLIKALKKSSDFISKRLAGKFSSFSNKVLSSEKKSYEILRVHKNRVVLNIISLIIVWIIKASYFILFVIKSEDNNRFISSIIFLVVLFATSNLLILINSILKKKENSFLN